MAQVRTRRDVWKLQTWDPILLWYAKAVAVMQTRPLNDATGWRYQAAIHEYDPNRDPNADPSDVPPSAAEQKRFWNQCQHQSWFFLPWHRMYLSCFERIIMKIVSGLGGPGDWALPYWNYSDDTNPDARKLPPAFRAATLPDGSANSLLVSQRSPAANNGTDVGNSVEVDLKSCLGQPAFISQPTAGSPGFGGPRTVFNHRGGTAGDLERVPHGSMHNAVGRGGWMSFFYTAALDPIFWLHHSNIDRLWEVWLARDPKNTNPAESAWLTAVSFELHDASGAVVSMTCSQVTSTTATPLLYEYEDVSDPLPAPPPSGLPSGAVGMADTEVGSMPEMVGATEEPLTLSGDPVTTALSVNEPTGPASLASDAGSAPKLVYLNIENITGEGYADSYSVYLNLPSDTEPTEHEELFAGLLPMFGVSESSDPTGDHPANGLQYTLDVTDLMQTLQAQDDWDPSKMQITFVPNRPEEELETLTAERAPVQVGRVSLYYSTPGADTDSADLNA